MFGKKRFESQLTRLIYQDFPWLWAIRSDWMDRRDEVQVLNAENDSTLFESLLQRGSMNIWLHLVDDEGRYEVVKIPKSQDIKKAIADTVYQKGRMMSIVTHVVFHYTDAVVANTYLVFRPGKSPNYFRMLLRKKDL